MHGEWCNFAHGKSELGAPKHWWDKRWPVPSKEEPVRKCPVICHHFVGIAILH